MPTVSTDPASHWQQLRVSPVQAGRWLALAVDYQRQHLPWQAAYAARQALRCDPTLQAQLEALDLGPWQDPAAGDAQLGRPTLPQTALLIAQFTARTRICPGDWLTWLYLARLHEMIPVTAPAVSLAGRATPTTAASPDTATAHQQALNEATAPSRSFSTGVRSTSRPGWRWPKSSPKSMPWPIAGRASNASRRWPPTTPKRRCWQPACSGAWATPVATWRHCHRTSFRPQAPPSSIRFV